MTDYAARAQLPGPVLVLGTVVDHEGIGAHSRTGGPLVPQAAVQVAGHDAGHIGRLRRALGVVISQTSSASFIEIRGYGQEPVPLWTRCIGHAPAV